MVFGVVDYLGGQNWKIVLEDTCFRQDVTVWAGKSNSPINGLFWWTRIWVTWLWQVLDSKRLTPGQLQTYPSKLWGMAGHGKWQKGDFLVKRSVKLAECHQFLTQQFSRDKSRNEGQLRGFTRDHLMYTIHLFTKSRKSRWSDRFLDRWVKSMHYITLYVIDI